MTGNERMAILPCGAADSWIWLLLLRPVCVLIFGSVLRLARFKTHWLADKSFNDPFGADAAIAEAIGKGLRAGAGGATVTLGFEDSGKNESGSRGMLILAAALIFVWFQRLSWLRLDMLAPVPEGFGS
jgi:hypothetical protein